MTKQDQYAMKLISQIKEIFQEESENYINLNELTEGNNANEFIHALANLMPTHFYNVLTNQDADILKFNHIANNLIHQQP